MKPVMTRALRTDAVRRARYLFSARLWYRLLTASRRRLPDFIIVGAQKAGTTSLFNYMAMHPQCLPSALKEVHYFDWNFARGENWYRMHFPLAERGHAEGPVTLCFESSPNYIFDPRVPARVSRLLPEVKLIFLLRNPVSRAYSHYQHSVRRGRERMSFEEALSAEGERLAGEQARLAADPNYQSYAYRHYSYAARGVYIDQLLAWQAHFPQEQMLVIQAEQMFRDPKTVFERTLDFLRIDPWLPQMFPAGNRGRYSAPMPSEARKGLAQRFAPSNERLFSLLGERYDDWE